MKMGKCSETLPPRGKDDGVLDRADAAKCSETRSHETRKSIRKPQEPDESREEFRAMVEAFDGLFYICSTDYHVEFMNAGLIERTGYDATGELCYRVLHDRESVCPWCVNDRVFKGETVRWEVLSPKDNRWYYAVNSPIRRRDGSVSKQAVIFDITDRKQAEEELRKLAESTKLFAYSVSHDLKTPAIGVYGLARLLQRQYADVLDERGKAYCDQIMRASEQIAGMVEKINVFISAKEVPPTIENVRLNEVLSMIREEFAPRLSVARVTLIEPEHLPEIRADVLSMLRIFRNLVDNALKYGGEGLSEIRIGYEELDAFHRFSVADDGAGIRPEDCAKVFDVFQRQRNAVSISGAGLGLAIVKEIAERHKGTVRVESGQGRGTVFYVTIARDLEPVK